MGKKYIIELESGTHIFVLGPEGIVHIGEPDVLYETVDGTQIGDAVINAKPYTEPDPEQVRKEAYEKGLSDAWECARKIYDISHEDRLEIFPETSTFVVADICDRYSASEAIEKIRQYEQEKEEQDGLRQNIQTIVDKCGYSLDEIATVLENMREGQDG